MSRRRNGVVPATGRVLEDEDSRFLTPQRCVRNDHGLAKATLGDENGLVPGTGNHKGCPYDGFDVAYFHRKGGKCQHYQGSSDSDALTVTLWLC